MLLQSLSDAIEGLFRVAESTLPDQFPPALIDLLSRHLDFDGAVLGSADPLSFGDFSIAAAHVFQRDPVLLDDYAAVSAIDPVTQAFLAGQPRAWVVDTQTTYAGPGYGQMRELTTRHRLRHLMLCGQPPNWEQAGRWVVLYRADDRAFSADESAWLTAYWVHMERAFGLNRAFALEQWAKPALSRGLALLDQNGRLESSDSGFGHLLRQEFGVEPAYRLPEQMHQKLLEQGEYSGRTLRARLLPLGKFNICTLAEAGPLAQLSPRERQVALRFAAGQTSRDIAQEIGVSQYTVQTQMASVYRKLAVSDKAALARLLAHVEIDAPTTVMTVAPAPVRPNAK